MPPPLTLRLLDLPSGWQRLDPLASQLTAALRKLLPPGRTVDLLHGTPVGHPSHPPLAQAALAGWTGAAVLAAAELLRPDMTSAEQERARRDRRVLALLGIGAVTPTVLTGLTDWADLHEDQQRTGLVHAATMLGTATLSVAACVSRRPRRSALLDVTVGLIATAGAALGGHLAYRWAAGPNHAEAFPHLAKEGWSRICASDELVEGQPILGVAGDEPIVLLRHQDTFHALADRCSHLAGPLHEGEVHDVDDIACLVCPWHRTSFALTDGAVVRGPGVAPQPVLDVRVVDGFVEVRPRPLPGVAGR